MGKWLLAILLTHAADPRSELVLWDGASSTVRAVIEHLPDGSVKGRSWGKSFFVVADRVPMRDRSFSGVLLRIDDRTTELCDRVFHASTPLITNDGRVFVERGRPGPETGEFRVDELTIDEIGRGTIFSARGYTTHIAGIFGSELIVYVVAPEGASLVAVDIDSRKTRPISQIAPFARDFRVDGNDLIFANRTEDKRWAIEKMDLKSGISRRLVITDDQVLAPHPFRGDLAYQDHGLRLLGGGKLSDEREIVVATEGNVAAVIHEEGRGEELRVLDGEKVRQFVAPAHSHIQVIGFVK
jgi:hypothetical protein